MALTVCFRFKKARNEAMLFITFIHFPLFNIILKDRKNIFFCQAYFNKILSYFDFHRLSSFVRCRGTVTNLTDNIGTKQLQCIYIW